MTWRRLAGVLTSAALVATLGACSRNPEQPRRDNTPTIDAVGASGEPSPWPAVRPAEVGLRAGVLQREARNARRARSSCFAVARDGKVAGDWNWHIAQDEPRQVFSITKSVASALVGIAIQDGDLRLEDRVSRYVPQWRGTASGKVTVRNLLANDSGREWSEQTDYVGLIRANDRTRFAIGLTQQHEPGTAWAYNNAAIQVLQEVLHEATGTPVTEYAEERLFAPLGMAHSRLITDASPAGAQLFFGLHTTCLDLLRFGQLYLDHGRVDGEQLLPQSFVEASVGRPSTPLNAAYGLLWWLNRHGIVRGATDAVDAAGQPLATVHGRLAPGAPADLFAAIGLGGQVMLADPGSGTIVVRLSRDMERADSYGFADAARVVTTAVR